ncbi:hypothetical protein DFH08DRAFT_817893 [Mycena albidolilacea]|uniref:Uncharacterized protein n=1 Tax=Mycena albidolilacea TaxID=1033008 RepID=A0AAD6ZI27_9AGAR|nr:hypothetical protein DFH08DRAFT_817893 [Mycena albidolilacea]
MQPFRTKIAGIQKAHGANCVVREDIGFRRIAAIVSVQLRQVRSSTCQSVTERASTGATGSGKMSTAAGPGGGKNANMGGFKVPLQDPFQRPSRPSFSGPLEGRQICQRDGHGTRSTAAVEPLRRSRAAALRLAALSISSTMPAVAAGSGSRAPEPFFGRHNGLPHNPKAEDGQDICVGPPVIGVTNTNILQGLAPRGTPNLPFGSRAPRDKSVVSHAYEWYTRNHTGFYRAVYLHRVSPPHITVSAPTSRFARPPSVGGYTSRPFRAVGAAHGLPQAFILLLAAPDRHHVGLKSVWQGPHESRGEKGVFESSTRAFLPPRRFKVPQRPFSCSPIFGASRNGESILEEWEWDSPISFFGKRVPFLIPSTMGLAEEMGLGRPPPITYHESTGGRYSHNIFQLTCCNSTVNHFKLKKATLEHKLPAILVLNSLSTLQQPTGMVKPLYFFDALVDY